MRHGWFIAATLSVSMVAVAQQQPKVINAQFRTQTAGAGRGPDGFLALKKLRTIRSGVFERS